MTCGKRREASGEQSQAEETWDAGVKSHTGDRGHFPFPPLLCLYPPHAGINITDVPTSPEPAAQLKSGSHPSSLDPGMLQPPEPGPSGPPQPPFWSPGSAWISHLHPEGTREHPRHSRSLLAQSPLRFQSPSSTAPKSCCGPSLPLEHFHKPRPPLPLRLILFLRCS